MRKIELMKNLKTKIVATIGPSSWDPAVMSTMIHAGMNVARVNGAFADTAELDKVTKLVRDISNEVSLMMDVKGPEVRLNKFLEPIPIKEGDIIEIGNDEGSAIYPSNYKDLYQHLKVGQRIVMGDGDVEMRLASINGDKMVCEVVYGETLKPGKAMNLPGADFATAALTEKDITNLKHSIEIGWDSVSASFIQNAQSARDVRKFLEGSNMQLIAKIEDQQGVDNIDEILKEVDGIMVARGGLGVELGLEKVPMVQRHLIERANAVCKPVITATQMLESMISNPRPTRAEANDVATAIQLGTDAVMLSGESAGGKYPIEAVKWLVQIAREVEQHVRVRKFDNLEEIVEYNVGRDNDMARGAFSMAESAVKICQNLPVKAVFILTKGGFTARAISRYKIQQDIYACVPDEITAKKLVLTGGIATKIIPESMITDRDSVINDLMDYSKTHGIVQSGDLVVVVVGSKGFGNTESSLIDFHRVA